MGRNDIDGQSLRERARKRADVLRLLRSDPGEKPGLVDRLGVSRSTVDRAIDSLIEAGLVQREDGQYRVTVQGKLVFESYRQHVDRTEALAEAAPLLDSVPLGAAVDPALFETGTVRVADPHVPEQAITEAVERLQSVERLRVFSPVVKSNYINLVYEQVAERGVETTLIVGPEASRSLASLAAVTDTVEELLGTDSFAVQAANEPLPYMLYLMTGGGTDTVGITVHDEGAIVGSVISTDPEAIRWGRGRFEAIADTAAPVPQSQLL